MAAVLTAFHLSCGDGELVTTEQIDLSYSLIPAEDLATNFAIIEHEIDGVVGYARAGSDDTPEGRTHYWLAPIYDKHFAPTLLMAVVAGIEENALSRAADHTECTHLMRCWMPHPGRDKPVDGTAVAWLQELGYRPARFEASMVRPNLDDILELPLPDGVDVRRVVPEHLRTIWEAQVVNFAGSFGQQETKEGHWFEFRDDPISDPSMWKVAWVGDEVVGQIRSFINQQENETLGRLRGYTEHISTRADWRGRGLASALLGLSLRELRDRGMTEAALGVDTENPADAFAIYSRLGFQLTAYTAIMDKPLTL